MRDGDKHEVPYQSLDIYLHNSELLVFTDKAHLRQEKQFIMQM